MLLARLAVDQSIAGRGLGRALLRDAMLRTPQAAEVAGIRILLVHAADEEAKRWYRQFDVEESPTDPLHLMVLLDDLVGTCGDRQPHSPRASSNANGQPPTTGDAPLPDTQGDWPVPRRLPPAATLLAHVHQRCSGGFAFVTYA